MKNTLSNRDSSADSFEVQKDNYAKLRRCGRRDVSPCSACGRIFTLLAMIVHKRTCLEDETCQCYVCRSSSRKIRRIKGVSRIIKEDASQNEPFSDSSRKIRRIKDVSTIIKEDASQNEPFSGQFTKINTLLTPQTYDLFLGKKYRFENSSHEKEVLKVKFVQRSIIQNPLVKWKPFDRDVFSVLPGNEKIVLGSLEYLPNKMASSSNLLLSSNKSCSLDNTSSISKSVEVNIHDCDRKLFCRYCNIHVLWKSFGIHIIQHCKVKNESVLKCPECYRLFSQPALYLAHYLSHNVDHPILCTFCSCSYLKCISTKCATESEFIENYPHHCYICFSHFSDSKSVINHMHLHSRVKSIQGNGVLS